MHKYTTFQNATQAFEESILKTSISQYYLQIIYILVPWNLLKNKDKSQNILVILITINGIDD
jgi:hypothetical protein